MAVVKMVLVSLPTPAPAMVLMLARPVPAHHS